MVPSFIAHDHRDPPPASLVARVAKAALRFGRQIASRVMCNTNRVFHYRPNRHRGRSGAVT